MTNVCRIKLITLTVTAALTAALTSHAGDVLERQEKEKQMNDSKGLMAADKPSSAIDEKTARQLAIEQYNQLFGDKYMLNPVDNTYQKCPKLDPTYFHEAKIKDGCWQVAGSPPVGWFVFAKVSMDGKWVQVTSVGFAVK